MAGEQGAPRGAGSPGGRGKPGKPGEECGVFGVYSRAHDAAAIAHNALLSLQHRGQESAGIAVLQGLAIRHRTGVGLVGDVFSKGHCLPDSHLAVGHVRYSTTGINSLQNAQPFVTEYLRGRIACAHNGNVINSGEIRRRLVDDGCTFSASSDSEVVSSLIAYEALKRDSIEDAIAHAAQKLVGAFSLVLMSHEGKLFALRDGWGFRPLCIGASPAGDYAIASESCALDGIGFGFVRDVLPGEMILIDASGIHTLGIVLDRPRQGVCIFEYVYFARPDSVIDGQSVYGARYRMGGILAREHAVEADVVCGVPDSGLDAAAGYGAASGIPVHAGFVKNRYIGRSFIYPTQRQREAAIRLKLNPLAANVAGKRIVLVDDSMVRGTTCAKIVRSLKAAGAREVHVRISAPPFRHECHFGTDIDSEDALIANNLDVDGIRRQIGADSLGYISIEGLREACEGARLPLCDGCFSGSYPVDIGTHSKMQFEGSPL
ncbi:MAG: amidophosphoribosyltransferase [Clostridiales bacterium]|nr:amidophosphoribosyltransferase [Clostridiales bacterium]